MVPSHAQKLILVFLLFVPGSSAVWDPQPQVATSQWSLQGSLESTTTKMCFSTITKQWHNMQSSVKYHKFGFNPSTLCSPLNPLGVTSVYRARSYSELYWEWHLPKEEKSQSRASCYFYLPLTHPSKPCRDLQNFAFCTANNIIPKTRFCGT